MNDRQRIAVRAGRVTFKACDDNPTSLLKAPVLGTRLATGKLLLKDFLDADQIVITHMTGTAKSKQESRDALSIEIEFGYDVLGSYAVEIKDSVLKDFAHYTPSDLDRMTGEELLEAGKNLAVKLAAIDETDLQPHGFEATDQADLQTSLTTFEDKLTAPETESKKHKAETADRDDKFEKFVRFMDEDMDTAAKPLRKKDPQFYRLYKICRKLHQQGHKKKPTDEGGGQNGEYVKKVPAGTIVAIDFKIVPGKVYLLSNTGEKDLKYFALDVPAVPAGIPNDAKVLMAGDEAVHTAEELGAPAKMFLFVANEDHSGDGEIAIDEVV